eukprot:TRINITY_DN7857_c0_g2_i1.p1 TRINITY_DN7857_c0_g2~~TRINITY_DN7857_c0_g2_i1.p1  ORF type:complete len:151 (-),score=52.52 TRINITY_DN7857_c0_g2_i1:845-1297(-)
MESDPEELKLPNEMLRDMQFENFQAGCRQILELDNEDIEAMFRGRKCDVEEVRRKYRRWQEVITPEEFNKQKRLYEFNSTAIQGNELLRRGQSSEALRKFTDALEILEAIEDKSKLQKAEINLRINVATLCMKMNKPEKSITECNKVMYR